MITKTWAGYCGFCDWLGCGASVMDGIGYSAWIERDHVEEAMTAADWWIGADGASHYCDKHPVAWASDPDDVAEMPRPFLLIHDGDTGRPDDDGKVSLVLPVAEQAIADGNDPLPEVTC